MVDFVFLPLLGLSPIGLHLFKRREFITTLTDDNAIAAAANDGGRSQPVHGKSRPIARGIPRML